MSRSSRLLDEASQVIPGGVNSPVRAFHAVGGAPPFIKRGDGPWIYDEDSHEYVDLVSSWGALSVGHAHPSVVEAVIAAIREGSSFGAPTEREIRLAQEITRRVPSVDKVRLCSSGTESTMHAIRLARGFTGRDKVVKMDGNYHGAHDAMLVAAGSGLVTLGIPGSPGVPKGAAENTIVLPYNDPQAAREAFAAEPDGIAAVILEPIAGNMGCIPATQEYLDTLRELCTAHGALLIFDEVMTGFRVHHGSAQAIYGIRPDLSCFGKVIGGGFPLAAFGGRADVMDHLAPLGPVYQAGTLSGNPAAVAAGLATLELLTPEAYEALETTGKAFDDALGEAVRYHGFSMNRVGAMFTIFFREQAPTNFAEAKTCDLEAFARFFQAALGGGVYLPPSQFEAAFYGTGLTGRALDRAAGGVSAALVAAAG